MLTKREQEYLKNKHQGGLNNGKGGKYELYYLVYELFNLIVQYKEHLDKTSFCVQKKDTFVDDLCFIFPDRSQSFVQIKNVKNLNWGDPGEFRTLGYDFIRQKEESAPCSLSLVLSDQTVCENMQSPPDALREFVRVIHFPYFEELDRYLNVECFLTRLKCISAYEVPKKDQLLSLAITFCGICSSVSFNKDHTLQYVVDSVNRSSSSKINYIFGKKIEMNEETEKILSEIDGLTFSIQHSAFLWCYKWDKGELLSDQFSKFEELILRKGKLKSFKDFENIITEL